MLIDIIIPCIASQPRSGTFPAEEEANPLKRGMATILRWSKSRESEQRRNTRATMRHDSPVAVEGGRVGTWEGTKRRLKSKCPPIQSKSGPRERAKPTLVKIYKAEDDIKKRKNQGGDGAHLHPPSLHRSTPEGKEGPRTPVKNEVRDGSPSPSAIGDQPYLTSALSE